MTRQSASCDAAPRSSPQVRIGFVSRRSGLLAALVDRLLAWQELSRSRVQLSRLDDHMLRDMGLTRADVHVEVTKPFWRV